MKQHLAWFFAQMPPSTEPVTIPAVPPISYEGAFIKMLLALLGLVLLVFFTIWVFRRLSRGRWGLGGSHKQIAVLERHAISPKSMLYLVEILGKKVVIAESQLEIKKIATFTSVSEEED